MLHVDVLDAYRADLGDAGVGSFTDVDASWLAFASVVQRALTLARGDRDAYLRRAVATLRIASGESAPDRNAHSGDIEAELFRCLIRISDEAEQAGAFALATTILDCGGALFDTGRDKWQGRMVWQQARILRKLGEVELAQDLLTDLKNTASDLSDVDLVALSWIGLGAVARVRGNFPDARQAFASALALEPLTDPELEIRRDARHGLLVSAAAAGDFDAALQHGMVALEESKSVEQRAEILTNLAATCSDAGKPLAALHTYLQVLGSACDRRVRISALGGAAVAAASLGKVDIVQRLASAAAEVIRSEHGFAHEVADLSRELYEAFALLGDESRAGEYRRDAIRRAEQYGYHEIAHRIESFRASRRSTPRRAVLGTEALGIAEVLESGDAEEMLASAMSSD